MKSSAIVARMEIQIPRYVPVYALTAELVIIHCIHVARDDKAETMLTGNILIFEMGVEQDSLDLIHSYVVA
jgi:hypothetical protein